MAEEFKITGQTKEERYQELLPQIRALISQEKDQIANLANICAALKYEMHFFWVGFYLVKESSLVLGPFQGPLACTRIAKGKGVCGKSWETASTIIVPDVEKFPGHIACSSQSKSEIVLPIFNSKKEIVGVLDIDSDTLNTFNEVDQLHLEKLTSYLSIMF